MATAELESRRKREFEAKFAGRGPSLRKGQIWEFVNTVRETVSRFELKNFDRGGRYGSAYLTNLDTGGDASITAAWLIEGEARAPLCHWRLAS